MKKIITVISIMLVIAMLASCSAPPRTSSSPAAESGQAETAPALPRTDMAPTPDPAQAAPADEAPPAESAEAPAMPLPAEEPAYSEAPAADAGFAAPADEAPLTGESESYIPITENAARPVEEDSTVTLSLKVDTAAYSNAARYIESGFLPPADAVRTEELINYFSYDTPAEFGADPLAIYTELAQDPFDAEKYLAFIRVKAKAVDRSLLPPSNITFLIDTSGSMDSFDKLPLLKKAFSLLTENLNPNDSISIVTYADSSSVLLSGVSGEDKAQILSAVESIEPGGSTAGADGIWTAYTLAEQNFIDGGNNRVILATDGDFNVGMSDVRDLSAFISKKRDSGVYLSVLGFGTGNIRDDIMETLSRDGNGNYSYIDSARTAKKTLVDELNANLFTIADDVKAQVEFNPANVSSYRLIGYENRMLQNRDFADDSVDAGEIGLDTDVVVMFELELKNSSGEKYGDPSPASGEGRYPDELLEVRIRYKQPGEEESKLMLSPVTFESIARAPSADFNFAASVAEYGAALRGSSDTDIADIFALAANSLGADKGGYRSAHLSLLKQYEDIAD